jgi:hypothetical protein
LAEAVSNEMKTAQHWIAEIQAAEKACSDWYRSGDIIIRRYKNAAPSTGRGAAQAASVLLRRYAILWSNVQTLGPAIYARKPNAEVSRRFKDEDPVGKVAADVLERALNYTLDAYDFDAQLKLCREDYLLPGRGQVWVRYVPHMEEVDSEQDPTEGEGEADEDRNDTEEPDAEGVESRVAYEEVLCDHVAWKDFLTNPTREWSETRWVARRVFMTRKQLVERFGSKIGNQVPLDYGAPQRGAETDVDERDAMSKRAQVYEVWDKDSKKAYWINASFPAQPLDERDDPLGLKDFFPCPKPLCATQAPDSTIPVPDYIYYQDQAEELDDLTQRIGKLQDALRMVGVYAGEEGNKLQNVFTPGNENTLIPIDAYDLFKEKGGIRGLIEWVPIDMVIQCLKGCYEARQQILEDIYQITGLSDIIRGASNPNETATAQGLKSQWGSLRVRDRQKAIQDFARDTIRIKGEIISEQFGIDTLKAMTGVQLMTNAEKMQAQAWIQQQQLIAQQQQMMAQMQGGQPQQPPPQAQPPFNPDLLEQPSWEDVDALLKNEPMRQFRIDIETDSTVEPDESQAKQDFVEGSQAVVQLLQAAAGIVPSAPYTAPLFGEMMQELARKFRFSRSMEDAIDKIFEQASQMQPVQPPGPEPADPNILEAEKVKGQVEMMKAQSEQQRTQSDNQIAQMEARLKEMELMLKGQELQVKASALARDPTPQGSA